MDAFFPGAKTTEGAGPVAVSVNAERSVLGAILLEPAAFEEAAAKLTPKDFSLDSHRRIYSRMVDLGESARPIDFVTLGEALAQHKELETVGGYPYLSELLNGVPDRPSIAHYIEILREASDRRRAAKQIEQAQRAVNDPSVSSSALAELGHEFSEIASGSDAASPRFSEDSLALRFSRKYGEDLRYVHKWGQWLKWDGSRWLEDSTLHVFDLARGVCRAAAAECGDSEKAIAAKLASRVTSSAVERLAAADRRHASTNSQWDCDPWALNTPEGTIDLCTGEIRKHRREDYITKSTIAGPGGSCDLWLKFLDRITAGNVELQSFLQRMVGYCLTGVTREHSLFFLYGTGANGKSVFLSTISSLLGAYAKTAPAASFTASATEQHSTDLAGLRGARFVTAVEIEDGSRWAESKIKALTGGDVISARFMRCDFFEYRPEFKLVIAGNHKPGLRSVDEAVRRRLHLLPFTVTIPERERDLNLGERLRGEFSGILSWALEGCLAWQRAGLNPPAVVRDATERYLAAEDAIGIWLSERCVMNRACWSSSASLFSDWKEWCEKVGERATSSKRFSEQLENRGFSRERTMAARGFAGIELRGMTRMTDGPV